MSSTAPRIVSTDSSERFDVARRLALRAFAGPLDQRSAVEPRRVERLQNVVAGACQEAGLAEIGLLGQHLRLREFLVDAHQFGGAAAHALLQRFIDALQRKIGLDAGGDVGIGRHDAAIRHRVGPQFDDASAFLEFELPGAAETGEAVEDGDPRFRRDLAARRQHPQHFVERHADPAHLVRQ